MTTSREPVGSSSRPERVRRRLLGALPEVFLGPDALAALDGRRGLLYGAKRHRQVDVFGVARAEAGSTDLAALVGTRFEASSLERWGIVGLTLTARDLEGGRALLLDELVAGDVVIVGPGPAAVLVHRGDCLAAAPTRGALAPPRGQPE